MVAKLGKDVDIATVRKVTSRCERCARLDPAVQRRWDAGHLGSAIPWARLGADIVHYGGSIYLTLIDTCTRYAIWKRIRNESARAVIAALEDVFLTIGPPTELFTDNGAVFRSAVMTDFLARWEVVQDFRAVNRPSGNGLVERAHRTILRMAKRAKKPPEQMTPWYNGTAAGHDERSPYEQLFAAKPKLPGVRSWREEVQRLALRNRENDNRRFDVSRNPYRVGERMFVKPVGARCTT